jgi:hypothetical protein
MHKTAHRCSGVSWQKKEMKGNYWMPSLFWSGKLSLPMRLMSNGVKSFIVTIDLMK